MARIAASAVLVLLLGALADAQDSARGALIGRATDATGAAVRDARVKAALRATGLVTETSTDARGYYALVSLAPGDYTVGIEADGFRAALFENVRLEVGRTRKLDAVLSLGGRAETIDVEDAGDEVAVPLSAVGALVSRARSRTCRSTAATSWSWRSSRPATRRPPTSTPPRPTAWPSPPLASSAAAGTSPSTARTTTTTRWAGRWPTFPRTRSRSSRWPRTASRPSRGGRRRPR
jgi:hypothetical protein